MPWIYKSKLGSRKYKDYEEETLLKAIGDCKKPGMSIAEVAKIYKVPHRTLRNKVGGQHSKSHGGQCALPSVLEDVLVKHLSTCADYGMPLEWRDIKSLVKGILEMEKNCNKKIYRQHPRR
ncbi:tigger transposable element-derived protein 2 [Biomphalaria glabrata]